MRSDRGSHLRQDDEFPGALTALECRGHLSYSQPLGRIVLVNTALLTASRSAIAVASTVLYVLQQSWFQKNPIYAQAIYGVPRFFLNIGIGRSFTLNRNKTWMLWQRYPVVFWSEDSRQPSELLILLSELPFLIGQWQLNELLWALAWKYRLWEQCI